MNERSERPSHFGILEIDVFGSTAKTTRLYRANGSLATAPILTERALHLLRRVENGFVADELEPSRMTPALGGKEELQVVDFVRR
jgi:hypothetical protein